MTSAKDSEYDTEYETEYDTEYDSTSEGDQVDIKIEKKKVEKTVSFQPRKRDDMFIKSKDLLKKKMKGELFVTKGLKILQKEGSDDNFLGSFSLPSTFSPLFERIQELNALQQIKNEENKKKEEEEEETHVVNVWLSLLYVATNLFESIFMFLMLGYTIFFLMENAYFWNDLFVIFFLFVVGSFIGILLGLVSSFCTFWVPIFVGCWKFFIQKKDLDDDTLLMTINICLNTLSEILLAAMWILLLCLSVDGVVKGKMDMFFLYLHISLLVIFIIIMCCVFAKIHILYRFVFVEIWKEREKKKQKDIDVYEIKSN